ncbi:MAG TPA: lipopolysaccharide heptosyltransferase II [Gemmatimonadales bacterium]|nr:lipopolysaccharide heptosyltransferase II [Gemmatimonadales bacterium]
MSHSGPPPGPRILLVRFSSIGDILLTTPLIRALRARHPGARIDALTKVRFAPLLADNPRLDVVLTPVDGETVPALARRLRPNGYTHHLDLHGSLRSRQLRLLMPGRWRGYRKHRLARGVLVLTQRSHYPSGTPPVPERYFEAAEGLDVQPDGGPPEFALGAAARAEAEAFLREAGLDPAAGIVALAPGAAHATKRWPLRHWIALALSLAERRRPVVVVGGPEDAAAAGEIAAAVPRAVVAAGRFGLQGTGALVARASALVSGDTGVMHMATGVGTPVVALFGPTVEAFGFFPYRGRAQVVQRDLACRPCSRMGGAECPLGHHNCLELIPARAVSDALAAVEAG